MRKIENPKIYEMRWKTGEWEKEIHERMRECTNQ